MGTINRLRWTAIAFGYILPTTGRIPNMHRLEMCAARYAMQQAQCYHCA
nr:hypothetical protein [uncultured Blautia sp.]